MNKAKFKKGQKVSLYNTSQPIAILEVRGKLNRKGEMKYMYRVTPFIWMDEHQLFPVEENEK